MPLHLSTLHQKSPWWFLADDAGGDGGGDGSGGDGDDGGGDCVAMYMIVPTWHGLEN